MPNNMRLKCDKAHFTFPNFYKLDIGYAIITHKKQNQRKTPWENK